MAAPRGFASAFRALFGGARAEDAEVDAGVVNEVESSVSRYDTDGSSYEYYSDVGVDAGKVMDVVDEGSSRPGDGDEVSVRVTRSTAAKEKEGAGREKRDASAKTSESAAEEVGSGVRDTGRARGAGKNPTTNVAGKTPKAAARAPRTPRTAGKAPRAAAKAVAERTIAKTSKTPIKTPARQLAKTPAKAPAKTPAKAHAKTPAKTVLKTPAKRVLKTPAKTPAKASAAEADSATLVAKQAEKTLTKTPKAPPSTPVRPRGTEEEETPSSHYSLRPRRGRRGRFGPGGVMLGAGDELDVAGAETSSAVRVPNAADTDELHVTEADTGIRSMREGSGAPREELDRPLLTPVELAPAPSARTTSGIAGRAGLVGVGEVEGASYATLRALCRGFGVSTSGTKAQLKIRAMVKISESGFEGEVTQRVVDRKGDNDDDSVKPDARERASHPGGDSGMTDHAVPDVGDQLCVAKDIQNSCTAGARAGLATTTLSRPSKAAPDQGHEERRQAEIIYGDRLPDPASVKDKDEDTTMGEAVTAKSVAAHVGKDLHTKEPSGDAIDLAESAPPTMTASAPLQMRTVSSAPMALALHVRGQEMPPPMPHSAGAVHSFPRGQAALETLHALHASGKTESVDARGGGPPHATDMEPLLRDVATGARQLSLTEYEACLRFLQENTVPIDGRRRDILSPSAALVSQGTTPHQATHMPGVVYPSTLPPHSRGTVGRASLIGLPRVLSTQPGAMVGTPTAMRPPQLPPAPPNTPGITSSSVLPLPMQPFVVPGNSPIQQSTVMLAASALKRGRFSTDEAGETGANTAIPPGKNGMQARTPMYGSAPKPHMGNVAAGADTVTAPTFVQSIPVSVEKDAASERHHPLPAVQTRLQGPVERAPISSGPLAAQGVGFSMLNHGPATERLVANPSPAGKDASKDFEMATTSPFKGVFSGAVGGPGPSNTADVMLASGGSTDCHPDVAKDQTVTANLNANTVVPQDVAAHAPPPTTVAALPSSSPTGILHQPQPVRPPGFATPRDIIRTFNRSTARPSLVSSAIPPSFPQASQPIIPIAGSAFGAVNSGQSRYAALGTLGGQMGNNGRADHQDVLFSSGTTTPVGLASFRRRRKVSSTSGGVLTDLRRSVPWNGTPAVAAATPISQLERRSGSGLSPNESPERKDGTVAMSTSAMKILGSLSRVRRENRMSAGKRRMRSPLGAPPSAAKRARHDNELQRAENGVPTEPIKSGVGATQKGVSFLPDATNTPIPYSKVGATPTRLTRLLAAPKGMTKKRVAYGSGKKRSKKDMSTAAMAAVETVTAGALSGAPESERASAVSSPFVSPRDDSGSARPREIAIPGPPANGFQNYGSEPGTFPKSGAKRMLTGSSLEKTPASDSSVEKPHSSKRHRPIFGLSEAESTVQEPSPIPSSRHVSSRSDKPQVEGEPGANGAVFVEKSRQASMFDTPQSGAPGFGGAKSSRGTGTSTPVFTTAKNEQATSAPGNKATGFTFSVPSTPNTKNTNVANNLTDDSATPLPFEARPSTETPHSSQPVPATSPPTTPSVIFPPKANEAAAISPFTAGAPDANVGSLETQNTQFDANTRKPLGDANGKSEIAAPLAFGQPAVSEAAPSRNSLSFGNSGSGPKMDFGEASAVEPKPSVSFLTPSKSVSKDGEIAAAPGKKPTEGVLFSLPPQNAPAAQPTGATLAHGAVAAEKSSAPNVDAFTNATSGTTATPSAVPIPGVFQSTLRSPPKDATCKEPSAVAAPKLDASVLSGGATDGASLLLATAANTNSVADAANGEKSKLPATPAFQFGGSAGISTAPAPPPSTFTFGSTPATVSKPPSFGGFGGATSDKVTAENVPTSSAFGGFPSAKGAESAKADFPSSDLGAHAGTLATGASAAKTGPFSAPFTFGGTAEPAAATPVSAVPSGEDTMALGGTPPASGPGPSAVITNPFGGAAVTPSTSKPTPSFGQSQPAASVFGGFGGAFESAPVPPSFSFSGAAPAPAAKSADGPFAGLSAKPVPPPPNASGGFVFGAGPAASSTPAAPTPSLPPVPAVSASLPFGAVGGGGMGNSANSAPFGAPQGPVFGVPPVPAATPQALPSFGAFGAPATAGTGVGLPFVASNANATPFGATPQSAGASAFGGGAAPAFGGGAAPAFGSGGTGAFGGGGTGAFGAGGAGAFGAGAGGAAGTAGAGGFSMGSSQAGQASGRGRPRKILRGRRTLR